MIRLAEQYHGMVCTDGSPCVVYQSVQPVARVALEVSGGGFVTFRNRKAGLEGACGRACRRPTCTSPSPG